AAPHRLDERRAALGERRLGQRLEGLLVERRTAGCRGGEERRERLAVAARARAAARDGRHRHAGIADEPFELREERGVERVLADDVVRNCRPPRLRAVYARAAMRGNE